MCCTSTRGFTLIELAIVLVIIGLITGAVIVGRELIHGAQMRATLRQIDMMNTAYNTFRVKYNCLPGDCSGATNFGFLGGFTIDLSRNDQEPGLWERVSPVSTAHAFSLQFIIISVMAINGNGNGQLDGFNATPYQYENFISLSILNQAKLVENFDYRVRVPIKLSTAMGSVAGSSKPAFWLPWYVTPVANSLASEAGHYYFAVASTFPNVISETFPAIDAYSMDSKIDNGNPITGVVRASTGRVVSMTGGPEFLPGTDDMSGGCLMRDAASQVVYNAAAAVRCAVIVKSSI